MANFDFGKTKSGFPSNGKPRRHPRNRTTRMSDNNFNSVVVFRLLLIRAISLERDSPPKVVFAYLLLPGQ
jgi:hypothetical protein